MTFSLGTRTFFRLMAVVLEPRWPNLGMCRPAETPSQFGFHHKGTDALVGRFGVHRGEHGHVVGDAAVGDPELGAVQNIIIAVRLGQAAQAGDIGSHGGFRSGKGEEFTVLRDGGQVFLFGGFIVAEDQRLHPQGIVEDAGGQTGADGRQFFRGHDAFQHTVSLAAVSVGDVPVDQAGVVGFVKNVHGQFLPAGHIPMPPGAVLSAQIHGLLSGSLFVRDSGKNST